MKSSLTLWFVIAVDVDVDDDVNDVAIAAEARIA